MDKIHFICASSGFSQKVCKDLITTYGQAPLNSANVIVALGGDGFMLSVLSKNKRGLPVYGINTGHVGFLMNPFNQKDLHARIASAIATTCYPLKAYGEKCDGKPFSLRAFNDIWVERMTPQAAHIKMHVSDGFHQETRGDGVLVATPLGCTGYYANAGGLPFYFDSKCLGLTTICANPAFHRILSENVSFELDCLESQKRPITAIADNVQIPYVRHIKIDLDKNEPRVILADRKSSISARLLSKVFEHTKN